MQEQITKLENRVKELEVGLGWVIAQLRQKKLLPPPG
ncbi:MAG: hypothetical protein JWN74_2423 [Acidobacteriaceae bacterium]|nr:hypothetical protein [Acidobacteriaceae bacterium]